MLQQRHPKDYVIATGQQRSVREFVELAGEAIGMRIEWSGKGLKERGYWVNGPRTKKPIVFVNARYFRPAEVCSLVGDANKARIELGWTPTVTFEELVNEMAISDLKIAQKEIYQN